MTLITHEQDPEVQNDKIDLDDESTSSEFSINYTLRPQQLEDYVGQERIKTQLKIFLSSAKPVLNSS